MDEDHDDRDVAETHHRAHHHECSDRDVAEPHHRVHHHECSDRDVAHGIDEEVHEGTPIDPSSENDYFEDCESPVSSVEDGDAGTDDGDDGIHRDMGEDSDEFCYTVLESHEIVEAMISSIRNVNAVVQIPTTTTRLLLNHFKWDTEKLMECYYGEDQDKMFAEAGLINPERQAEMYPLGSHSPKRVGNSTNSVCGICFIKVRASEMTGVECGHHFCTNCWANYLTVKINNDCSIQIIRCPAHDCNVLVEDNIVMRLLRDEEVKRKYQRMITNSFVECNRLIRWCPTPDCRNAIKVVHYDAQPVLCLCKLLFCFACGESWHEPVRCRLLKKWSKKCDDESETSNWIAANTKDCPKCGAPIEKDGGCNHIMCKRCRFDFCWVCLGPWEPHGSSWYACNRYDEDEARQARSIQENSRSALTRYLHYFNRYMNHSQSLRFENQLVDKVRSKMEDMQQLNMSWIEVQFLERAVQVLCQSRRTLKYTYVFAFYLEKNNECVIFEDNQRDLEMATEQLSEYLERELTDDVLRDIKQKVQDKSRYCESRRKALVNHVGDGYSKDLWHYQESL